MGSLIAKEEAGSFTLAPEGNHVARCIEVIDLGTTEDEKFKKKVHKIRLSWELPNELHEFKPEKGPEPFVVSREFTLALGEKAHLRKFLESWRGRKFTKEELEGFDVIKILDAPCMVNVIHSLSKKMKHYADVSTVAPLAKGTPMPPRHNKLISLTLDEDFNKSVFDSLPEFIRKKIEASDEFKSVQAGESIESGPVTAKETTTKPVADDEPPF